MSNERTPEDDHGGPFCDCGECEACYRGQVTALRAELAAATAANTCDACAGTGTPTSGLTCMCGGTGKMSDASVRLRESLVDVTARYETASRMELGARTREDVARAGLAEEVRRIALLNIDVNRECAGLQRDLAALRAENERLRGEVVRALASACGNAPCPVCGDGPSGEWSEGSEVDCDGCGTALYVEAISPCLGTTTFTLADAKCPACAGRGFIGNAADAPDCTACKGEGRRELTLAEAKAAASTARAERTERELERVRGTR